MLWHNLMLVMIPERAYIQHFEMPALQSAVRMTQHQEAFRNFQMAGVSKTMVGGDADHAPYQTQEDNGGFKDLRGKARNHRRSEIRLEGVDHGSRTVPASAIPNDRLG